MGVTELVFCVIATEIRSVSNRQQEVVMVLFCQN